MELLELQVMDEVIKIMTKYVDEIESNEAI